MWLKFTHVGFLLSKSQTIKIQHFLVCLRAIASKGNGWPAFGHYLPMHPKKRNLLNFIVITALA
jgi:hypothetical protein